MRPWMIVIALLLSVAPAVSAGGILARIEGPGRDGVTYTARTFSHDHDDTFEPWAIAEGIVGGKRQSILIRIKPTSEHGVYQFARTWPTEGRWMIRYMLGHPPAPATVVTLGDDGSVLSNKHYYKSDGSKECSRVLGPGSRPADDGC